jgi:hypothetical protein
MGLTAFNRARRESAQPADADTAAEGQPSAGDVSEVPPFPELPEITEQPAAPAPAPAAKTKAKAA